MWTPPHRYPTSTPYQRQIVITQGPPTSATGTTSLVLGILGALGGWCMLGIPCLLAIMFGHAALPAIRLGQRSGRGLAVAGLVLGYVFAAPWIIIGLLFMAGVVAAPGTVDPAPTP